MDAAKKKPSLALVVSMGKGKPSSEDDAPESSSDESSDEYEAARDELADVLGVKDEDREAFGDALRAFVTTCK